MPRIITWVVISLLAVTLSPIEAAEWHLLQDQAGDRFEVTLEVEPGRALTVSRVTVEGMTYDGPLCYTAMLVREEGVPRPGVRSELLTLFVRGQYRLLALAPDSPRLYAGELYQQGASVLIRGIQLFDAETLEGVSVGPRGSFHYASCNSASSYCVLVDSEITMVNVKTSSVRKVRVNPKVPETAADPSRPAETGSHVGGGFSLEGRFVEMVWSGDAMGELLIRNAGGQTTRRIEIGL